MKRLQKLILLALVLVALGVCYMVASRVNEEVDVTEVVGSYPLSEWTADDLTALSWTSKSGSWSFVKNNSVWVNAQDSSFPVNQSTLSTMASRIAGLTASRELTDVNSLSDYGLAEPVLTVTVEGNDGTSVTYAMGDETPFADGYYVSVSGRDAIYTIETSLVSTFDKTISELASMESLPEAENVTRITVGESLDATLDEDSGLWFDTVTGELLDSEAVASLVDDAQSIFWYALVAVSADDEELTGYGLDGDATRLTLYDGEDEALTVLLGGTDDEGDRYAKMPNSSMVYTIYGSDVSALLAASTDTLWNPMPVTLSLDSLSEAVIAWDGGELTLAHSEIAVEEAQTDTDVDEADSETTGSVDTQTAFTINGVLFDEETISEMWTQLTALYGNARVEETASGALVLSVSMVSTQGEAQRVEIYSRDVDSYLVPVSAEYSLLVSADSVDKIVRTLKQMNETQP